MEPAGQHSAGAASRYQILGHLATGGMAELYLARAGDERPVVLKRIMADYSRNPRFVAMFLDEARLAAQLVHPNIARVLDIGKVGDSYYFTMEYVHGENVRDLLQRVAGLRRRIPPAHVLSIAIGAAAGLHHAHEARGVDGRPLDLVHRDVSPSNLMLSYAGEVKLVDFGIAKAADRMTETRSGVVKGKVSYMSPEQCTGQPVDRRSDVFSLGIILFEMATMTRLFKYATDFETMNHIVNVPVPSPRRRRPDVPRDLEDIILRALARRPEDRFATAGELQAALVDVATRAGLAIGAAPLGAYLRELFGERPEPWMVVDEDRAERPRGAQSTVPRAAPITHEPMADDPPTAERRLPGYSEPPGEWEPPRASDPGDAFEAATEVVPPGEALAALAAARDDDDDAFAGATEVVPPGEVLAARPPAPTGSDVQVAWFADNPPTAARPRVRWWLWGSVIAAGIAIGTIAALATRRSDDRAAQGAVDAAASVPAADAIDAATASDVAGAIDAAPVAIVVDAAPAAPPVETDACPAATDEPPPTVPPPRPRPRPPRPTPPTPPAKCGDAMGIYPPCE